MSVDDWFQSRKGQSLLVPGAAEADRGQCVQAADYALNEVYGLPYVWANAVDWWGLPGSLAGNFDKITDGSVKKGDFVIFNSKVGSVYGHIDIAMQDGSTANFQGADSNWGGDKTLHLVQHTNQSFVIGALRPKGTDMADKVDATLSRVLQHGILGRNGLDGRPYALDPSWTDTPWVGADLTSKFLMELYNSPEAVQWRDNKPAATDSIPGINKQLADAQAQYVPASQLYVKKG